MPPRLGLAGAASEDAILAVAAVHLPERPEACFTHAPAGAVEAVSGFIDTRVYRVHPGVVQRDDASCPVPDTLASRFTLSQNSNRSFLQGTHPVIREHKWP